MFFKFSTHKGLIYTWKKKFLESDNCGPKWLSKSAVFCDVTKNLVGKLTEGFFITPAS